MMDSEMSCTPPEAEDSTAYNLLPEKSREVYEKEFSVFEMWCDDNGIHRVSEGVLINYFQLQSETKKPSTLWTMYSMIRACLNTYKGVDITQFNKLLDFLRMFAKGYEPKQSEVLEAEDIKRFLREADDRSYLAIKVILIMGYSGACRREELKNMSIDDVDIKDDAVFVSILKTKTNLGRAFAVTEKLWIDLIKKYIDLRPSKATHRRFFLTYRNGYCLPSPIGINSFGKVPKIIAEFLKLPNPELFTGHCFKRSSIANCGDEAGSSKRRARCTSSPEPEGSESAPNSLLPKKSREVYEKELAVFEKWCKQDNVECISENVLIAYFKLQSETKKFSTLWATYSMLKTCLNVYKNVDISQYKRLQATLKSFSKGYEPKQSKILELRDINRFLQEADDKTYLATKVILIMGYSGACRREELINITIDDVEFKTDAIFVSLPKRTTNLGRLFAIREKLWIDIMKKYVRLRSSNATHRRFFTVYRHGYCIASPIGINTIAIVPKIIATFLELPNPELFTGECFRRSKMSHMANNS